MFVNEQNPGEAISAVKALQKASAQGQRIYQITQVNQASTLPTIHHAQVTMDEIRHALNAGKQVTTHTEAVSVPGWSGAGYIITDPTTGDGAYKISGGGNGGFIKALDYLIGVFEIFLSVITTISDSLGGKIKPLESILNAVKLLKFMHNMLLHSTNCYPAGGIVFFYAIATVGALLLTSIAISLANPLAAFAVGFVLDEAISWLLKQTSDCVPEPVT